LHQRHTGQSEFLLSDYPQAAISSAPLFERVQMGQQAFALDAQHPDLPDVSGGNGHGRDEKYYLDIVSNRLSMQSSKEPFPDGTH
jgi:hypothetical protein